MKYNKLFILPTISTMILGASFMASCNSDGDSSAIDNPINLAVTSFSLKAMDGNPGLDSAYFSIDLDHRVIFNADSLRKGTDISKLLPSIAYSSNVDKAYISMSGGSVREEEIEYSSSKSDSIDFTGDVTLRLVDKDANFEISYKIKVNVHQMEADQLVWDELASDRLPSRLGQPLHQKSVTYGEKVISLIQEKDLTYTIAYTSDFGSWTKRQISPGFTPVISSFTGSDDALWLMAHDGSLYKSDDLDHWTDTGEIWHSMIGAYGNSVVGTKTDGNRTTFTQYPLQDINTCEIPADFPTSGTTNFVVLSNLWTTSPVAFFAGGISESGTISDATWAFDGSEWIKLSSGGIPAIEGASIIPYYNYRASASGESMIEYKVWMLLGGRLADGNFNRTVYISYDNGVNWNIGSQSLQLPEKFPAMVNFDNVIIESEKCASLSDYWKKCPISRGPLRVQYDTDGDNIIWQCPYIFIFGGYNPDGKLYDTIWRGVLSRLTFTPII